MPKTIVVDRPSTVQRSPADKVAYYCRYPKKKRNAKIKNIVSKALAQRGLNKVEYKYKDELNNSGVASNSGLWASSHNFLNDIIQGDGHSDRDGFEIQPVSLTMKISATCLNGLSAYCRLILIRWDGISAPTALNDIFTSWTSPLDCTTNLYHVENRSYFKVLMDKRFDISSLADSDGRYICDSYHDLRKHKPCKYTSSITTGDANMTQGRYYLIYFATDTVTLNFSNRFKFTG